MSVTVTASRRASLIGTFGNGGVAAALGLGLSEAAAVGVGLADVASRELGGAGTVVAEGAAHALTEAMSMSAPSAFRFATSRWCLKHADPNRRICTMPIDPWGGSTDL